MADKTGIQWTDATWNPVTGCAKVSPGCAHCYAETVAKRLWATSYPDVEEETGGPAGTNTRSRVFTDVQCHEDRLEQPLRWTKPRRIFVNSMSDLFHDDVPDDFIDRVFAVMSLAPQHTFQILTKRAERMRHYFEMLWHRRVAAILRDRRADISRDAAAQKAQGYAFASLTCGLHNERFLPNVWLGVSVENQHFADERIPLLLQTPAAVRFISAEPLLGSINLREMAGHDDWHIDALDCPEASRSLSWVIVGGESGPGARPCDIAWVRSIVQQCRAARVPVFVKQLGTQFAIQQATWHTAKRHDRKGGDPAEWPSDLQVREFPASAGAVARVGDTAPSA